MWLERPNTLAPFREWSAPWKEHVLVTGPDVMFDVVDLDPNDETVEVCALGDGLLSQQRWMFLCPPQSPHLQPRL